MFCGNCGAENPAHADFCQNCGTRLSIYDPVQSVDAAKRKRQMFIAGGSLLLLLILCVVVLLIYNGQKDRYHREKMDIAGKYLQEMNYEKAEAAYLEAIEIDPKKEDSYIQLADLYVSQGKKQEAIKVLEKGKKKTSGKEIEKKMDTMNINTADQYKAYSEEELAPETGIADLGMFPDDKSNQLGIISTWEKDVDGDGVDEMIAVVSESHDTTEMRIILYKEQDGEIVQVDEILPEAPVETEDVEVGHSDSSTEVFVKEHEGNYYLCVYAMETNLNDNFWENALTVYEIKDKFSKACAVSVSCDCGGYGMALNEETIYLCTSEDLSTLSDEELVEEQTCGLETLAEALAPYGLESKIDSSSDILLLGYEEGDDSEVRLAFRARYQMEEEDGTPSTQIIVEGSSED